MEQSGITVWTDDEVATQVLTIVRDAEKYVILVSPYLDLGWWGHAKTAFELALRRGVKIRVILRSNTQESKGEKGEEDIAWLLGKGVEVRLLENLHAKIYLNEKDIVVGSANLTQSSMKNSHEIVLLIKNDLVEQKVRDYVTKTLMQLAKPLESVVVVSVKETSAAYFPPAPQVAGGICIRCHRQISLDHSKPLCDGCYDEWAEWEKPGLPRTVLPCLWQAITNELRQTNVWELFPQVLATPSQFGNATYPSHTSLFIMPRK